MTPPKKSPAKKKPAAKKAAKKTPAKRATGRNNSRKEIPVPMPDRTPEQIDQIIADCETKSERWREAWRMQTMGVPVRVMAERLGVTHTTAAKWANNWVRLLEADPLKATERATILARLDDMAERMTAELVRLEAADAGKDVRGPVWLDNSKPLLDVLALKWRIVAPRDQVKNQKVTVEVGAQTAADGGGQVPAVLSQVLAKITVSDVDGEAA